MQKELRNTLMYFLDANFLCFLGCRNLDAKFGHFIISKINSKLPLNVSGNSGYMCAKRLNRAIKSKEMASDWQISAHNFWMDFSPIQLPQVAQIWYEVLKI